MGRKKQTRVKVDSELLKKQIYSRGYSIRRIQRETGISARIIRECLASEEFPPHILAKICNLIGSYPPDLVRGFCIWMRIGVCVPLTNDEMFELMDMSAEKTDRGYIFDDVDFNLPDDPRVLEFFKRAIPDGETYIPSGSFEDWEYWYWAKKEEEEEKNDKRKPDD